MKYILRFMAPTASEIIKVIYDEATRGTVSYSKFFNPTDNGFPFSLHLISSNKKYAAVIHIDNNPEDYGFIYYGYNDPRNAFKGIDLRYADLYYSDTEIKTGYSDGVLRSEIGPEFATILTPLNRQYIVDAPAGKIESLRIHAEDDRRGYMSTNGSIQAILGIFPELTTVRSSITYTLGANEENLILTGDAAIDGTGNSLNNIITGNVAANTLNGGVGTDTMRGGLGNDIYVRDNTGDVVTELANQGTDTVQSSVTYTLGENLENITLTGTAAVNATGNGSANTLTGNSGGNILNGGLGKDSLTGSNGVDKFIYKSIADSGVGSAARDVITDFRGSLGEKIDLSAIDAYSKTTGNQAFAFIGSSAFTGTKGEARFSGGVLQMNTGTDKSADMEIALTGVTSLSSTFLVL
jgi:Ca2+-binding RTX toxin-like protein